MSKETGMAPPGALHKSALEDCDKLKNISDSYKLALGLSTKSVPHEADRSRRSKDKALLKKLLVERNTLNDQVVKLGNFNLAREPDFVRGRLSLRNIVEEVDETIRRLDIKYLQPILEKLNRAEEQLSLIARKYEEESEQLAQQFLDKSLAYDGFIEKYIKLRKEASKKRVLADRLAREKSMLADTSKFIKTRSANLINPPAPTPPRRKKVRGSSGGKV